LVLSLADDDAASEQRLYRFLGSSAAFVNGCQTRSGEAIVEIY
jgi:hypothetical protein